MRVNRVGLKKEFMESRSAAGVRGRLREVAKAG